MSGKLVIISGLSGAGKSTLVGEALHHMPELSYLRTITTRPRRPGEDNSHEYEFVSTVEYEQRSQLSPHWDHTEYHGYSYGADVNESLQLLANGQNIICAVAPDPTIIGQMFRVYGLQPTVWLDVPAEVARQRVQIDSTRAAPQESDELKLTFDHVFRPVGDIATDGRAFANLVKQILQSE